MISEVSVADITGEDLRVVRRTLGRSQMAFARALGLSPVYLATLERGGRKQGVSPRIARKLLEVTGEEDWDAAVRRVLETDNLLAEIRASIERADFDGYDPSAEPEAHADIVHSDIE